MLRYSKKQRANALKKKREEPIFPPPPLVFEPIPVPSPLGEVNPDALTFEQLFDKYGKGKPDGPPDPQYDKLIYGHDKEHAMRQEFIKNARSSGVSLMTENEKGRLNASLWVNAREYLKEQPPLTYDTEGVCIVQAGEYRGQCYYPRPEDLGQVEKEGQKPSCYYHLTAEDFGKKEEEEDDYEIVEPEWKAPEPLWTDGGHIQYPAPRDGTIYRPEPEKPDN